jgi:hypothetical protein
MDRCIETHSVERAYSITVSDNLLILTDRKRSYLCEIQRTSIMRFSILALIAILSNVHTIAQPEGRVSAKLIYHPPTKAMLLIDGYQIHPETKENPVWSWNGKEWKKIDASGPASRSLSAGALNKKTNDIVMFGGVGKKNYEEQMSDVWSFDGKSWNRIETNSIGPRDHHQMVYADHLDAFISYGGQNAERNFDSATYVLKEKTFKALNMYGPGSRFHFGMAYDPLRKKVVLYSGGTRGKPLDTDVWEFDGTKWERIVPVQKISGRVWASMVYNDKLKMVLMHGGKSNSSDGRFDFSNETWGWDGKTWTLVATNGPTGLLMALGYDPKRDVVVAFGGSGDTTMSAHLWELHNGTWKKISENGTWEWKNDKYVKIETEKKG